MAGESAPTAIEVNEGASIPNHLGNITLRPNAIDPNCIILDVEAVPPTLHLRKAPVTLLFGETNLDGEFVEYNNELSRRQSIATGIYIGPGSELKIY
jgi:hypothetical protein